MHAKEIMKVVQASWKRMSEKEKESYKQLSLQSRSTYEQKRRKYDA